MILAWLLKPLTAILGGIGVVSSGIGGLLTLSGVIWVGIKALKIGFVYVALPIVIYNVLVKLIFDFMEYGLQMVQDAQLGDLTIQFTGMGGWMAQQIMLPQAFSVFMSFLAIRFMTRFIPFMK